MDGRFRARGLRVVSVTRGGDGDEREAVGLAAREERMTYPCYLDPGARWVRRAGLASVPSFLLVGRDGRVAYRFRGTLTEGTPEYAAMVQAVERALAP